MLRKALQRFRDLPLQAKGQLVVAIPLIGLVLGIFAFYLVEKEDQAAQHWITRTFEARSEIQQVRSRLEEAETSMLGYLVTRDPARLRQFEDAERALPGTLNRLEAMVADDPSQQARARRVGTLVFEALRVLESRVDGQASLTAIRRELDGMRAEADRLLEQRREHARSVWKRGYVVIGAGVLFAPAGAILAMLLFATAITRRIQVLDQNAQRLAQGQPIAPMRSGKDVIGRLEQSLGAAAALLAEHEQALRRATAELEIRVAQRTAELAQSKEELSDANRRLEAIIDASPLAILRLDPDGNVQSWNHAAERIFGYEAEEILNQPLSSVIHGSDGQSGNPLPAAARGDLRDASETRLARKDGTPIDVRLWTAPLRNAAGDIRGEIVIAQDFTEHRRLGQQFVQAQKMEAIGRLAGGAAHDFNNLITVISGYGHMLLDSAQDNPDSREAIQEVLKASDRAAALARQLLVFSRRQEIQPKVLDLNELVANVQRMLARVLGEDIELKTGLAPDLDSVMADSGQLEQVIVNLALNARDAMPSGGKLSIETANVVLDETYARAHGVPVGSYAMLAVSDTGHGMTAETKSHLFEPFFTTKNPGAGTGLGLATVYGIVKQHGGDVSVYSEPGHGTSFKIYLPRIAQAAGAKAVESLEPSPPGTETLLVVEDQDGVRKLIREVLAAQGYTVLEAESGERALEISSAHEGEIDLLVTDIVMPKMHGTDLAEAFALLRPSIKTLFLSGYAGHAVIDQGVLRAGSNFLPKPFTPDSLARMVRKVLDREQ